MREPLPLSERSRKPPRDCHARFGCTEERNPAFGTEALSRSTRTPRSAKHLSDDGCDQTERGEPTHSPDQQLRHGAVSPCCQRRRLIQGKEQKEPVSKKEPRRRQRGSLRLTGSATLAQPPW